MASDAGAEVLARLNSSPTGLSDADAAERLVGYGPNTLQEEAKPSRWSGRTGPAG